MNKHSFKANYWLQHTSPPPELTTEREERNSYKSSSILNKDFELTNFLIPGWKGEGIISKSGVQLKKTQEILWKDAKKQFLLFNEPPNQTLKNLIFNEFIDYSHAKSLNAHSFDTPQKFWENIFDEQSPYRAIFDQFIEEYTFRVITIYLYKIQFITQVAVELDTNLTINNLQNPGHFLSKVFKRGSKRELTAESLRPNQYSWYRPSSKYSNDLKKLGQTFQNLGITELMKLSSPSSYSGNNTDHLQSDREYSHSISHKSFGLFLNTLMVFYPLWNKETSFSYPQNLKGPFPEIYNTLFSGDKLSSFAQGHWLAQEENLNIKWSEVLCPDFSSEHDPQGDYFKYYHELQLLTFLIKLARVQNYNSLDLAADIMRKKYSQTKDAEALQPSLFSSQETTKELLYDRIVLNISDLPKKNPHHFLTTQIFKEHNKLSKNGHLYVLSNQKLFVPSQKNKVSQLLEKFKVEALFNFDELSGKGEIPNNIIILKKRESQKSGPSQYFDAFGMPLTDVGKNQKESCPTFKWQGELNIFYKFTHFVEELFSFFNKKRSSSLPIFQSEVSPGLYFEFHQDAILDGMLLSSAHSDTAQVTHPTFFKNLTKHCSPLSTFFNLESLHFDGNHSSSGKNKVTNSLLGIGLPEENRYQAILILGFGDPLKVTIELCSFESYKGRMDEYGTAFYQYYGLIPKRNHLNINLFREYFSSEIGLQIIQLSLNGGTTKLKSKLKTLLIPNFFSEKKVAPPHITDSLALFKSTKKEILSYHPQALLKTFQSIEGVLNSLVKDFPWTILGMATHFKTSLEEAAKTFSDNLIDNEYNFKNPLIIEGLLTLNSKSIYPTNEDVFIDFNVYGPHDIHLPLTRVHMSTENGSHCLELFSNKQIIARIFSDKDLLSFIKFILASAIDTPISTLLYQIRVPALNEFKEVLENSSELKESIAIITERLYNTIQRNLTNQVTKL